MEISFNLNCKDETLITLLETIGKFVPMPREAGKLDFKPRVRNEAKSEVKQNTKSEIKEAIKSEKLEESQTSRRGENSGREENQTSRREEAKATMKNKESKPRITLEQLRERLALMSQQGNHENVKALLRKYGGERLTDIPEDSYEELFNEAVNEAAMEEKA